MSVPGSGVGTVPPLDVRSGVLTLESRSALVERYRYDDSVSEDSISNDLIWLSLEWRKRLEKSISAEADRTNNWSLLWKTEAIYESMDSRMDQELVRVLRNPANAYPFQTFVAAACTNAFRTTAGTLTAAWQTDLSVFITSGDCKLFQADMGQVQARTLAPPRLRDAFDLKNPAAPGAPGPGDVKGAGPAAALAVPAGGTFSAADGLKLVQWWILRKKAAAEAKTMFAHLSSWNKCDGRMKIPERRPPIEGFNHLSSRVVEWLLWPYMSPAVFPTQRDVMIYGPAGAGKTIISQLVAFDLSRAMLWADIKRFTPAEQYVKLQSANLNNYATVYFVDVLKLRSPDPEVVGARLRNYLSCLQYEVARDKNREKLRKMAILVLDNLDTLFFTDDELRQQPRAERKASQIKSWIYKASPEVVVKLGGNPAPSNDPAPTTIPAPTAPTGGAGGAGLGDQKAGGQGTVTTTTTTTTLAVGGRPMAEVVGSILSPSALETDYPDVRVIWSVRYAWKLPASLLAYVKRRQLFVDLPASKARRSYLEDLLRDDLYSNIADRIVEEQKLRWQKQAIVRGSPNSAAQIAQIDALLADSDRKSEPDEALYTAEQNLKYAVVNRFLVQYNEWNKFPVKPTPGNLLSSIVHGPSANPQFKVLSDAYIKASAQTLDAVTTASGMSLEGYCKLQSEYGLSVTDVDSYLVTTGKKRDGYAGNTPFGYTLEDLKNFYGYLKATVNSRLLKQAFELKQAFFYGSTRFASTGCKDTASQIERTRGADGNGLTPSASIVSWAPADGEQTTCKVALGPDLTDLKTGVPALPLWSRFGSHRILKMDDAIKALNGFERYVTPKPDYPEFVNYAMFGTPRINRPMLAPGQISQICRARPGPASTFLFPASGILTPAASRQATNQLPPWSVLFATSPRLGGGGGGPQQTPTTLADHSFRGQYNRLVHQQRTAGAGATPTLLGSATAPGALDRAGGAGERKKKRRPRKASKRHGSTDSLTRMFANQRLDDDRLPIDAVFQRQ